jgi:hypothetical protein
MISALVSAGLEGGYRANPWLARVHWQAGDRPLPRPGSASLATQRCGVDPAEILANKDIAKLGRALHRAAWGTR